LISIKRSKKIKGKKIIDMSLQRLLLTELKRVNPAGFYWLFPAAIGATWLIWDALDEEWLISLNLATDPEALNKRVENARLARLEALKKPKPTVLKSPESKVAVVEEEEEEPDEEEDAPAEDKDDFQADEEEEESPVDDKEDTDDVPAGEDGDDEAAAEEEEEEEEETEVVIKPLYDPIKGKKLGKKEVWDNFTIKALNMSEDDDDDEEEEEEGTL
jgi:hypothetical protein